MAIDDSLVLLLEQERLGPARVLVLALDPGDVWDDEDAVAATVYAHSSRFLHDARELLTREHLKRLDRAIDRLRAQLPVPGAPRATRALAAACSASKEERVRAALLLLAAVAVEELAA